MQLNEFNIGLEFYTGTGKWRCTDVGTRTIAAIYLDDLDPISGEPVDPSWFAGPPYAVSEHVFDEYDLEGCSLEP